jgi:hypothetical protein
MTPHSIEVLEGLEPVRRRPGMYIGGVDERALHHLAAEVLDNAMDEAVAGLRPGSRWCSSGATGRSPSPTTAAASRSTSIPNIRASTALEVILTKLHSGGKFSNKAYATSGGLHGVGVSVVNALVERDGGRGRPQQGALPPDLLARRADLEAREARADAQPARHQRELPCPTPRFSARRRGSSRRGSTGWPAPRPICSPGSRFAGAATRR